MSGSRRDASGLSLIELMIAMVIGLVLMLGLLRVFAASREAARMSEGLSRVQENGRFALDYLQRDLRMVGHMGCINDQARLLQGGILETTFADTIGAGGGQLDMGTGLRGYEAAGTAPHTDTTITIGAERPTAAWVAEASTPALPAYISALAPLPGSDIVELRYFSAASVPVRSVAWASPEDVTLTIDPAAWDATMPVDGFTGGTGGNLGLMGISDCRNAATFQLTTAPDTSGNMKVLGSTGMNLTLAGGIPFMEGQTQLHRLEAEVFYVAWPNDKAQPGLYRARFVSRPGQAVVAAVPEELVEGIDNMQLVYGTDMIVNLARMPSGYMSQQAAASDTTVWNRVGLVQVALLARSNERASSEQPTARTLLGAKLSLPADGRYRAVYDSTIAMRNRVLGTD